MYHEIVKHVNVNYFFIHVFLIRVA